MQAQTGGMVLELIGHVAEPQPKRKQRSFARRMMCGGSVCTAWSLEARLRQGLPAPSVAPVQRMEGRFPDPHPLGEGLHFVWLACMLLVAWRVSAASPLCGCAGAGAERMRVSACDVPHCRTLAS